MNLKMKYIRWILLVCLSICVWNFGVCDFVMAEGSQTEFAQYTIVFVDEENQEVEDSATLETNQTLQLLPQLRDADGNCVENVEFTYQSSDEKVATVSENGCVTAQAVQQDTEVEIIVEWTNSDNSEETGTATYTILVKAVAITEVTLEKVQKTLIVQGTYTIKSKVSPAEALQDVTYRSSNTDVASVTQDGVVTALKEGTAMITVTSKRDTSKSAKIEITVIDIPVSMELNETVHTLQETNSFSLTAQLVYQSGKKVSVSSSNLIFQSQDETIATVDNKGLVTALKQTAFPKATNIQVIYNFTYIIDGESVEKQLSQLCQITVVSIPVTEVGLNNSKNSVTMKIGDTYTLLPYVLPANASNQKFKFKSKSSSIASVSSKGVIKAKSIGETVITVSSAENSNINVTFKVKVYQTTFNVAELGANGTDSKSDRKVINKVLKYATLIDEPIKVIIPAGTYYIDKSLTIYSDTTLCLEEGAVIKRFASAGASPMLCSSIKSSIGGYGQCKNIKITGGVWDGNANGSKSANCIYIGHAQNVTIKNTVIKNNSGAHLIELAGVNKAVIENVELYGYKICKEKGYTASQADKEAIQLDYCSSVSTPAMKPHDNTVCKNVTIRNCNIHDYMSGIGTHTSVSGVYMQNIKIQNNKFTNITNTCINLRNFKKITISGNKASGYHTFMYARNSSGTVTNNNMTNKSFKKKTKSGLYSANGITISGNSNFTITKNTIANSTSNGICVWDKSTAKIKNNTIKNSKLYGIRTKASTITLSKNKFSKNKKGLYDTYKDAKIKSSDDIRAYYVDIEDSYTYTGKAIKPKITLKGLNKKYYKVSYKNNKNVGKATITIKGKGKVKGTLKVSFKIVN